MKALSLVEAGQALVVDVAEPLRQPGELLLKVEMIGLCGTALNSFRGRNPLVTYPRILGHEVGATVLLGNNSIPEGTCVSVSPYTSCGVCPSCRRGRENACRNNQTLVVQRNGSITERIAAPPEKVYPSQSFTKIMIDMNRRPCSAPRTLRACHEPEVRTLFLRANSRS